MSPIVEPNVLDLRQYSLRHVGPRAAVWPDSPAANITVLNRTDMVARQLPAANIPNSADFAQGKWIGRLYDAGEGNITFPNKEASDGVRWAQRFSPDKKKQWLEIWLDEYLESVLCITKVTPDRNQVLVEGYDGKQMCKAAFERDWVVVKAPRDVIERGTQLWVPIVADNFPVPGSSIGGGNVTTPTATWLITLSGSTTTATLGSMGGLQLFASPATPPQTVSSQVSSTIALPTISTWRTQATLSNVTVAADMGGVNASQVVGITVAESSGDSYSIQLGDLVAGGGLTCAFVYQNQALTVNGATRLRLNTAVSYAMTLESDGEWVWAFINGQLIGCVRRISFTTTSLQTKLWAQGTKAQASATFTGVLTEIQQPFLQQGSDKGDYVLPGTASTYPTGGLHARYFNNADLQGDNTITGKIHHPARRRIYGTAGTGEYAEQQDATINHPNTATPTWAPTPVATVGSGQVNFSVMWFGAIYLKLGSLSGSYQFSFTADDGVRVWIGATKWGDQIIDGQWAAGGAATAFTASIACGTGNITYQTGLTPPSTAPTTLAGTNSDGTVTAKDGWYPIVIEYYQGTGNAAAVFQFTPPQGYTDPGGTALAGGTQVVVPATSLSPLGCVDQRHQGVSHFDLIQKTAVAFGYQYTVKPKQLESGLFPGVLAPRLREGKDYDPVIEPDDSQRKEGMLNYQALNDGTDQCASLWGNGAGFQNGNVGQLQASVFDPLTLQDALFDMQGWQDVADASFLSLLQATLNSELGLRLGVWVALSGDPVARQRLAYTWPLPGSVQQFRWRPGDGAKVAARDINIQDTSPRQMLEVTRNIHPNGAMSTSVAWAARAKHPATAIRKGIAAALRPQRNYQKQLVTLTGSYVFNDTIAASGQGSWSLLQVAPGDVLVRVYFRVDASGTGTSVGVVCNNTASASQQDVTTTLSGPFSSFPFVLDVTSVAVVEVAQRIYFALLNKSTTNSVTADYQVFADVLR